MQVTGGHGGGGRLIGGQGIFSAGLLGPVTSSIVGVVPVLPLVSALICWARTSLFSFINFFHPLSF